MSTAAAPQGPDDRLDSWKEIAAYLKRGVRTVQRWERVNGLPVHRLDLERQGSVFAYRAELDAWWESRRQSQPALEEVVATVPKPEPTLHRRWVLLGATGVFCVLSLGLGFALWTRSQGTGVQALNPIPLTSDLGSEVQPTFSPDGDQVAYAWDGPAQNHWDIYVKMVGSDAPLRLTKGEGENALPAWSPDGGLIAFRRFLPQKHTSRIILIPPIGGQERLLAEDDHGDGPLAWSPDNRWIVASSSEGPHAPDGLIAIEVNTGKQHRLTRPPRENWGDVESAVSPDGASIIFTRDLGSTSELFRVNLTQDFQADGEPRQITANQRWTGMPAFTPDGNAVVYASGIRDDVTSLWLLPLAPGSQSRLVFRSTGSTYHPALSRRGNRLAFSVGRIFRVDTWKLDLTPDFKPAGPPVRLISSTHTDYNAQYSPDGARIVFHSTRSGASEIWTAGADGSNAVRLTNFGAPITGSPRWSPDGRWIVFDSNTEGQFEVYRILANGGNPERLTSNPATDGVPSYSRDGRSIYFMSNRSGSNQVWKMSADGSHPRQITRQGGYLAFESYDGRWVFYSRADGDSPLYRVPVNGGEETQVLPRVNEFGFCVAAKGLLFSTGKGNAPIEFLDLESGKVSSLYQPERQMTVGLSLSADGRHLLFPQRESSGSDLMLVENFH